MLLPLLLAAADPAPVSDVAYIADCSGYATRSVCGCVADQLQQSGDGRMMLELATARDNAATQTDDEVIAAVAAIRKRYGVPEGTSLAPRLDAVLSPAAISCEAEGRAMMRRALIITLAAGLVAGPALAADSSSFTLQCQAKGGPAATCICMASELEKTTDGSVVLDSYDIADMPEADRNAAKAAMMARYKLSPEDMRRIGNAIPTLLESARNLCDTE